MGEEAPFDIAAFLAEPLRPAQTAAVSRSGVPVLGSFWFLFAEGRFWFNSRFETPLPQAIAHGSQVAVLVDDFTPPERIRQVRVRGPASLEAHDPERVEAIYRRYLGDRLEDWPRFFRDRCQDRTWGLWSVIPATGLAVASPQFGASEIRWDRESESPLSRR